MSCNLLNVLRGFAGYPAFSVYLICLSSSSQAETIQLYDHGTAPCYLYTNDGRGDAAIVHVTVVTGTVWMHDSDYPFDVRLRDAAGNRISLGSAGSMYIPLGTPAGTVVSEFDYQNNYPFCIDSPNPIVYGFPTEVYQGGTEQTLPSRLLMLALSDKWAPILKPQAETGMGYQVASVILKDGRVSIKW